MGPISNFAKPVRGLLEKVAYQISKSLSFCLKDKMSIHVIVLKYSFEENM
jgi:hypothetical protein